MKPTATWLMLFTSDTDQVGRRERVWACAMLIKAIAYFMYPAVDLYLIVRAHETSVWVLIAQFAFAAGSGLAVWLCLNRSQRLRRYAIYVLVGLTPLFIYLAYTVGYIDEAAYPSIVSGLALPIRPALGTIAAFSALQVSGWLMTGALHLGRMISILQIVLLGLATMGLRRMVDLTDELIDAREKLARRAVDRERLRCARDMHDALSYSLALIALKGNVIRRMLATGRATIHPDIAAHVNDIELEARQSLAEIRHTISAYRSQTEVDRSKPAAERRTS